MRNSANTFMLIVGIIAALVGVTIVYTAALQLQTMSQNFGVEFPAWTLLLINGRNALWVLPLAVPLAAFLTPVRKPTEAHEPQDKRRGIVALVVGMAIAIGLPLLWAIAMYMPVLRLGQVQ